MTQAIISEELEMLTRLLMPVARIDIENRVEKGGYNINTNTVRNRFGKRFEELLAVLHYCDEATFYDNDNGFVTVAKFKDGELQTIGPNRPKWLAKLMEKRVKISPGAVFAVPGQSIIYAVLISQCKIVCSLLL